MDIKSLITIEELPTVESTNPEQEYLLLQTPEKTGKMPLSNLPSEASKIGFDNKGTNLSSNTVQTAITELDSSLSDKVSGFTSDTYEAVTGLAYDPTNKKLGLKVGADTVTKKLGSNFKDNNYTSYYSLKFCSYSLQSFSSSL